jgi:hypothetical protein
MNITKDIISDLFPIYVANECSADTRALVDEYLKSNPREAEELRRIMSSPVTGPMPHAAALEEVRSLREARRRVRRRSFLLGVAIFFSLTLFSFIYSDGHIRWIVLASPKSALVYSALALASWTLYAIMRHRSKSL